MCEVMRHRGPDDEGFYQEYPIGLGMRRLSIIDLEGGHQPMSTEDQSLWVVFNGEIYNFQEIRRELEKKGYRFRTRSDTEVILHSYKEYGEECVKLFRGMFGFALWDKKEKKLILARDPLGIKPLHYYLDAEKLIFSSEIKSILTCKGVPRELNFKALDRYLTFEYVFTPETIFQKIYKLPPAHILVWSDKELKIKPYWDIEWESLNPVARNRTPRWEDYAEQLYGVLKESVKLELISDVPLGAFLSGGIDSSSVVALMSQMSDRPVKTFSIGFEDQSYNELDYARKVAKHFGTDHHEFILKPNIEDLAVTLMDYLDEPLGDFSIFPTYLVSKVAREQVTVALSGDGGDELFAGYDTYIANRIGAYYEKLPGFLRNSLLTPGLRLIPPSPKKKGIINLARRFVEGAVLPPSLMHARWMTFLTQEEKSQLYTDLFKNELADEATDKYLQYYFDQTRPRNPKTPGFPDPLIRQQYVDLKTYLPDDILTKVDRMSMATSLEARVPLLDHKVVEFAFKIPSELKLKGFTTKYILKKTMAKFLPKEVLYKKKQGFSIPIKNWLRAELKPLLLDLLSETRIQKRGYFNWKHVNGWIQEHLQGRENHSHRLWALMVFEMWHQRYL
jgi:asparagine synthase (glutamine-hydrolysing)